MRITKRQLRRIIREEQADVTPKYDKDSALVGDQSKLKDPLQKAIIDKTVEDREEAKEKEAKEKSESIRITKTQLRRIIREAAAQWPGLSLGREDYGQVGKPGWSWSVYTNGAWQDVTLTDDEKKSVDSMLDLDVNIEDVVIDVLQQSRGSEIEDIEAI
mgnify:CR=1 FL=1